VALLRKMTYEDKASYGSTPPCRMHDMRIYVFMYRKRGHFPQKRPMISGCFAENDLQCKDKESMGLRRPVLAHGSDSVTCVT